MRYGSSSVMGRRQGLPKRTAHTGNNTIRLKKGSWVTRGARGREGPSPSQLLQRGAGCDLARRRPRQVRHSYTKPVNWGQKACARHARPLRGGTTRAELPNLQSPPPEDSSARSPFDTRPCLSALRAQSVCLSVCLSVTAHARSPSRTQALAVTSGPPHAAWLSRR